jgi:hypothetical protein
MVRTKAMLRKRLRQLDSGLILSRDLFGDVPDCDFELVHYVGFLDRVASRDDLIRGLKELDPFVDDALAVAEGMNEKDFQDFKKALIHERSLKSNADGRSIMPSLCGQPALPEQFVPEHALVDEDCTIMPPGYDVLLMPERFIPAHALAAKAYTTLEVVLIRIMQHENGP